MRRVLSKQAALLERFHDQGDIALFQVTDAAVHELGAAARRAFAEIVLLQQEHVVAARTPHRPRCPRLWRRRR